MDCLLEAFGATEWQLLAWRQKAGLLIDENRLAWERLARLLSVPGTYSGAQVRAVIAGEPMDARHALAVLEQRAVS
jgi:hypothetical protein